MSFTDLSGKIAVVTGIAGQLGPHWVEGLISQGAKVVGLYLPGTENDDVFSKFYEKNVMLLPVDIRSKQDIEAALKKLSQQYEVPHILVANAGIDHPPTSQNTFNLNTLDRDSFFKMLEVNIWGTFQTIQIFGAAMTQLRRGSIIAIGSLYSVVSPDERFYSHLNYDPPFIKHPAYGASKAAIVNCVKYFSTHWAKYGVRINALSPGGVLGAQDDEFIKKFSERVPMGRLANSSEVVSSMLFLASDASSYITGINLCVDGGYTAW